MHLEIEATEWHNCSNNNQGIINGILLWVYLRPAETICFRLSLSEFSTPKSVSMIIIFSSRTGSLRSSSRWELLRTPTWAWMNTESRTLFWKALLIIQLSTKLSPYIKSGCTMWNTPGVIVWYEPSSWFCDDQSRSWISANISKGNSLQSTLLNFEFKLQNNHSLYLVRLMVLTIALHNFVIQMKVAKK